MGVLPLQFAEGTSWKTLGLTGAETVTIDGITELLPRQTVTVQVAFPSGATQTFEAKVRIDTENELDYYRNGGILHYVLRELAGLRDQDLAVSHSVLIRGFVQLRDNGRNEVGIPPPLRAYRANDRPGRIWPARRHECA
jgi:hypothetical protein